VYRVKDDQGIERRRETTCLLEVEIPKEREGMDRLSRRQIRRRQDPVLVHDVEGFGT